MPPTPTPRAKNTNYTASLGISKPQARGVHPYENGGGARQKFSKTPQKGTRFSFCGRVASNSFTPLRGTNPEITDYLPMIWPFSSKKLRSRSYLCNKYGYGFCYFIRLMTLKCHYDQNCDSQIKAILKHKQVFGTRKKILNFLNISFHSRDIQVF